MEDKGKKTYSIRLELRVPALFGIDPMLSRRVDRSWETVVVLEDARRAFPRREIQVGFSYHVRL